MGTLIKIVGEPEEGKEFPKMPENFAEVFVQQMLEREKKNWEHARDVERQLRKQAKKQGFKAVDIFSSTDLKLMEEIDMEKLFYIDKNR